MDYKELKELYKDTFFAKNQDGEMFTIASGNFSGKRFYSTKTYQKNGWIKTSIYYENGDYEELYKKG